MRDSMVFYRSFFEAIKELQLEQQAIIYTAIFDYGLNKIEPKLSGVTKTVWTLIKPQLDANYKKFENGSKPKKSKTQAKNKQNGSKSGTNVNDNDNGNNNVNDNPNDNKNGKDNPKAEKSKKTFEVPSIDEVKKYFEENGYTEISANSFYQYYSVADWKDGKGNKVKNWKQKAIAVWFKPENKKKMPWELGKEPNWKNDSHYPYTILSDGRTLEAMDYYGLEDQYNHLITDWK